MAACAACREEIKPGGKTGIRDGKRSYHVPCAPEELLRNAVEEWEAIVSRGVEYFVEKYSVDGPKAPAAGRGAPVERFASLGARLKAEARARGSKGA